MLTRCKACLEKVKNKNLCKNMRQLCNLLHTQALVAGALQSSYMEWETTSSHEWPMMYCKYMDSH